MADSAKRLLVVGPSWVGDMVMAQSLFMTLKARTPGATLGVMGGGQLGRMFVHAAQAMGYRTAVLDPDPASPSDAEPGSSGRWKTRAETPCRSSAPA